MSEFERLTWRTTVGTPNFDINDEIRKDNIARSAFYQKVCARLAAYEDSGLSPEEVQELAKTKEEGRLVVLPCKVGDTIYRIISYKCNAVCNKLNACNSFIYNACKAEFYICLGTFQFNDIEWIGKTVFLTREEAEKAIGGKEDV